MGKHGDVSVIVRGCITVYCYNKVCITRQKNQRRLSFVSVNSRIPRKVAVHQQGLLYLRLIQKRNVLDMCSQPVNKSLKRSWVKTLKSDSHGKTIWTVLQRRMKTNLSDYNRSFVVVTAKKCCRQLLTTTTYGYPGFFNRYVHVYLSCSSCCVTEIQIQNCWSTFFASFGILADLKTVNISAAHKKWNI